MQGPATIIDTRVRTRARPPRRPGLRAALTTAALVTVAAAALGAEARSGADPVLPPDAACMEASDRPTLAADLAVIAHFRNPQALASHLAHTRRTR